MGRIKKVVLYIWYRYVSIFFRLFPIRNNRIVIENFFGKGYGDNPKYIAQELLKQEIDFEIVWLVKSKYYDDIPSKIKQVKRKTLKELYYLSTSKIWIDDSRKPLGIIKRKKQFYIQTWHAPLGIKKAELDSYENLSSHYKKVMKNDSKYIDLMSAGCDFNYNFFKNSFLYNGEVAKYGTPRCDIFFDKKLCASKRKEICKKYNINLKNEIILYAPTFRDGTKFSDIMLDLESLYMKLSNKKEITILYRFHPNTKFKYDTSNSNIVDVTSYEDIQELLCAVDFLITDYSSCSFDMLIANKPCLLYVPDLEKFLACERGLCFSFDELPFPKATTEKELKKILLNFDINKYLKEVEKFSKKINLYEDGQASYRIVKRIIELVQK